MIIERINFERINWEVGFWTKLICTEIKIKKQYL
jgi:hypothetical protein